MRRRMAGGETDDYQSSISYYDQFIATMKPTMIVDGASEESEEFKDAGRVQCCRFHTPLVHQHHVITMP